MTQGFDIDELERLLAAATPEDEWFVVRYGYGDSLVICRDEAGNQRIAFMAVPGGRDHLARNRTWKAIKANAALIVTLHNSAPAMLTEIRELRAENARLKGDGGFLLARLGDLEWHDGAFEQTAREYFGHVEPAIERFRAALGEPQ